MSQDAPVSDVLAGIDLKADPGGLTLAILVAPRASREQVGPIVGDRVKVAVTAPAVEGRANAAVVASLARAFGVRRSAVTLVAGQRGKRKTVRIAGATAHDLCRLLRAGR